METKIVTTTEDNTTRMNNFNLVVWIGISILSTQPTGK